MIDESILAAAIVGLELKKSRLEDQILSIRTMMGAKSKPGRKSKLAAAAMDDWESPSAMFSIEAPKTKKKRVMSPEGRARIAEAVKRRWATARGEV
jgi:electron transfer flavoprotein alpha/beta subunit